MYSLRGLNEFNDPNGVWHPAAIDGVTILGLPQYENVV